MYDLSQAQGVQEDTTCTTAGANAKYNVTYESMQACTTSAGGNEKMMQITEDSPVSLCLKVYINEFGATVSLSEGVYVHCSVQCTGT